MQLPFIKKIKGGGGEGRECMWYGAGLENASQTLDLTK